MTAAQQFKSQPLNTGQLRYVIFSLKTMIYITMFFISLLRSTSSCRLLLFLILSEQQYKQFLK